MRKRTILIFLAVLCCCAFVAVPTRSSDDGTLRVTGTFVGIGGRYSGRTTPFTLIVRSVTPPNQIRELNEALSQGGQDGLLKSLSKMEAGRIQIGTGIGLPANAIIADPWTNGGTRLTVFYERNLRMFELRYGTRSEDYRVGYAEMFLDRNGHGEGTLIPAARVRLKGGNTWEVEDFGVFPARLLGLRASGQIVPR
jgi:hypothetical protein